MANLFEIEGIKKRNIVEKENNCSFLQKMLGLGSCPKPSSITKEQHEECTWWRKKLGMCKKNKQTHVVDCDCKKCLKECNDIDMSLISTTDPSTMDSTDPSTMDSTDPSTMDSTDPSTIESPDSSTTESPDSSTMDSTDSSTTESPDSSTTKSLIDEQIKSMNSVANTMRNRVQSQIINSTEEAKKIKKMALAQVNLLQKKTLENAEDATTNVIKNLNKVSSEMSNNLERFRNNIKDNKTGGRKGNRKTKRKGNRKTKRKGNRKTKKKRTKRKGTKRKGTKRKGNRKTKRKGTKKIKKKISSKKYKILKQHHYYHHRKH